MTRSERNDVKRLVHGFLRDESGQDLIEYALIAALIGLGAISSLRSFATKIGSALSTIGTTLTSDV